MFHISFLKLTRGHLSYNYDSIANKFVDNHPTMKPKAILDKRSFQIDNKETDEVLDQWEDTSPEEATWGNMADLEDKVIFKDGGMIDIRRTYKLFRTEQSEGGLMLRTRKTSRYSFSDIRSTTSSTNVAQGFSPIRSKG